MERSESAPAQTFRPPAERSRVSDFIQPFLRNRGALLSAIFLTLVVLVTIFGETLAPYDPTEQVLSETRQGPSTDHWFGTDQFGRDIFSRVLAGARNTLGMPLMAIGLAMVAGVLPGLIAGYVGSWIDSTIMRLVDIMLAFPNILLALIIVTMLGTGLINIMFAIGISLIPVFIRMTRGSTLSVREETYIEAARVLGSGNIRILLRHILPNLYGSLLVLSTTAIGWGILASAALNFLGLGVAPPTPEWGRDLSDGRDYLVTAWWITTFPGLAIMMTILAVNIVGDTLAGAVNPRLRNI